MAEDALRRRAGQIWQEKFLLLLVAGISHFWREIKNPWYQIIYGRHRKPESGWRINLYAVRIEGWWAG
jgi:hypothetical protein